MTQIDRNLKTGENSCTAVFVGLHAIGSARLEKQHQHNFELVTVLLGIARRAACAYLQLGRKRDAICLDQVDHHFLFSGQSPRFWGIARTEHVRIDRGRNQQLGSELVILLATAAGAVGSV